MAATPLTGGVSGVSGIVGATALTITTGMSIALITAVAFLGLSLVLKITDGYDREFNAKGDGFGEASMKLKRNKKKKKKN
ncbi:MAG: hypothetical protein K2Q11_01815 [Burkholderiaceae bacterium]|nr:hypothetical protein [Burkholderiaceae bacterium]